MKQLQEMTKKTDLNEDDINALREAMRGVKPLIHSKITPHQIKKGSKPLTKTEDICPDYEQFIFSDYEKFDLVGSDDLLQYSRPGLQHKVLRNLRTGQYNAEATLDLHGMTAEQAKNALSQFLLSCKRQGVRHVLIIHGKGRSHSKPILKNKLNHWLRQTDEVLAFCSAIARDGSSGALYVLLRRERFEK